MRFARSLVISLCAVAAASCGPTDANGDGIADGIRSPDSVTAVAPSTPIGSLSGQVMDTRFNPLADTDISVNVGGPNGLGAEAIKTKTDAAGFYFVKGLPAGAQFLVTLAKGGYATARTTGVVPSSAGNFPINNGNSSLNPILLTQLNGQLKFLVVTRTGRPAKQVKATLEAFPASMEVFSGSSGYGSQRGSVVVDATADDSGMLTFSGIPAPEELSRLNAFYVIHVSAHDENGDGVVDSGGFVSQYSAQNLLVDGAARTITLPDARDDGASFRVVGTNVASLNAFFGTSSPPADNMLKPGDQIFIAFNEAIEQSSVTARLADESGTVLLASTATIGPTGTTLTIQPSQALTNGSQYRLSVRIASIDTGAVLNLNGFIICGDISQPKPFAVGTITFKDVSAPAGVLNNGEVVTVVFNQPITSYGSPTLALYFNADLNADGSIGFNGAGEFGALTSPFTMFPQDPPVGAITNMGSPPTPVVAPFVVDLKTSGYTTTFSGTMSGLPAGGLAVGTAVRVGFLRNTTVDSGYQTAWLKQVNEDVTANLATAPLP
jgi:methionine-rich copper-binding protein CopC